MTLPSLSEIDALAAVVEGHGDAWVPLRRRDVTALLEAARRANELEAENERLQHDAGAALEASDNAEQRANRYEDALRDIADSHFVQSDFAIRIARAALSEEDQ